MGNRGNSLVFEADAIVAFKDFMETAWFQQHELGLLAGDPETTFDRLKLWSDIRKLVTGQAVIVDTAHELPPVDGSSSSTIARRGSSLWHNGRQFGVLQCSELKDVKTYADLAAYFKPEAHPPEEVLDFLNNCPRLIPADWNLHGGGDSWAIFLSTRNEDKVSGLVSGLSINASIHRCLWDAGDADGLEETDYIVVYEDAI